MAVAGKGGSVSIGAARIAELKNWSLDLSADDLDVTTFDSNGWKKFIAGLREWSGSFEGEFDSGDTTGQGAILAAWLAGTALSLTFTVAPGVTLTGNALVKVGLETPVDGTVTFSCDFQGSGALSIPA